MIFFFFFFTFVQDLFFVAEQVCDGEQRIQEPLKCLPFPFLPALLLNCKEDI